MSFTQTSKGDRKAELHIKNTAKLTRTAIRAGFYHVGKRNVSVASKDILAKDKTGRIYGIRRGKVVRRHRASALGETFANLSGAARRTLGFAVHGSDSMEFGFKKNQKTFYTEILETSLNRPALGNTVKSESGNSHRIFEQEAKKALQR